MMLKPDDSWLRAGVLSIQIVCMSLCMTACMSAQNDSVSEQSAVSSLQAEEFAHPEEDSAWATQALLLTEERLSEKDLKPCLDELASLADLPTVQSAWKERAEAWAAKVEDKPELYHWCYYQSFADLEQRLAAQTLSLAEKKVLFTDRMQVLWVLAFALQKALSERRYFSFLQNRYIKISKDVFGRDIEFTP